MDHTCYKCGSPVEEGIAFCPHCNAPQIRVALSTEALSTEAPTAQPLAAPPMATSGLQWSRALGPAAMAGLIASFLMLVPLGAFGLGMILAGILSVVFYRRWNPAATLTPSMGARLGAVTGLLGYVMFLFMAAVAATLPGGGSQLRQALHQAVEQSASRATEPQAQHMLEFLRSPQGLAMIMIAGMALALVAFVLLTTLGGALGAVLLRRKPTDPI